MIDNVAIPAVYALLQAKTIAQYRRVCEIKFLNIILYKVLISVHERIPFWEPITVMSDFEAAAMRAVEELFPNTTHNGCLFHMSQALYRKVYYPHFPINF